MQTLVSDEAEAPELIALSKKKCGVYILIFPSCQQILQKEASALSALFSIWEEDDLFCLLPKWWVVISEWKTTKPRSITFAAIYPI